MSNICDYQNCTAPIINGVPICHHPQVDAPNFECRYCDYTSDEYGDTHVHAVIDDVLTDDEISILCHTLAESPRGHLAPWVSAVERILRGRISTKESDLPARIEALIVELDEGGDSFLTRRHIDADGLRDLLADTDGDA